MDVIVDCYGETERSLSWYYYVEDKLEFPFEALCIHERAVSPLKKREKVTVVGMTPEQDCESEIFVMIQWEGRRLGVPLGQLESASVGPRAKEAIEDWHYWLKQGYRY